MIRNFLKPSQLFIFTFEHRVDVVRYFDFYPDGGSVAEFISRGRPVEQNLIPLLSTWDEKQGYRCGTRTMHDSGVEHFLCVEEI